MNTLLLINTLALGIIGVIFTLLGTNIPSRALGIGCLMIVAANVMCMVGV